MSVRRNLIRFAASCLLAAALVLPGSPARAHDESPGALEEYLHGLADVGDITEAQHEAIEYLYFELGREELTRWFVASQVNAGRMSAQTGDYVAALLHLEHVEDVSLAPVPKNYAGDGNVTFLGHSDPQPPNPYYSDNTSTGQLYSGIWGYAVGSREYALQVNSGGLHVLDVTDPATAYRVQYIPMAGGRIWRDVDVYEDLPTGKTYAYVGAQSNGNLWIVDLSYLSGSTPHGVDSDPIPPAGYVDRGRTNYGHTVSINDGLLFMNSANSGSTLGCQIFDLAQDPWNPPIVAAWSGSQHDCHDSFARTNVPGSGGKDLLYSADGYARSYRILDISSVRSGGTPTLVGQTAAITGIYGHSNWLTDDSQYLYAFDEFNIHDVAVFDVSSPATPTLVTTFQWSGDQTANSRVHNCQIRGDYLLCGYYEAGFRVFDISNPANAVEVGKWETWRDPDGDGNFNQSITGNYNGAWNLFAYLPSGNVLVSDMKSGTFVFHVDPVAVPSSPGTLSATPGSGKIDLAWGAAAGATGYGVHRGTTSGGPYTTLATQVVDTSFTDAGVSQGTTYYYVVSATNAEGESADSNQASATPAGGGPHPTLWMSFKGNTAVPGVGTVADEDVVSYDEVTGTWALEFDGSDVGLGALQISGLAVLPGGDLLLSFTAAATIGGIAVDDSDVVRFTPTSLGSTTAGTFSLYFDGSDVGLTASSESVDAVALATDGRLIVSTTGNFSGTGASGLDEDLFVFTGTLGSSTSGSFALYFDGSDVGLSTNNNEDLDAAAVTASGDLLFSTLGAFAVTGVSGADEDVAQFSGTFGSSTSGSFSLRQDLSALGIATSANVGSLHIVE
jgi:choice-of-anchor B domain-containing protein